MAGIIEDGISIWNGIQDSEGDFNRNHRWI